MQAKGVVEAVKEWLAKRSKSEPFYCGQCPKMEQCGLAPSETCLTKLEVLANGEGPRPCKDPYGVKCNTWVA